MKIFFMRHGLVENPAEVVYGRLAGFSLSKKGEDQVKETVQAIGENKIRTIFTSPLSRCKESAEIAGKVLEIDPKRIIVDGNLNELKFFKGEGDQSDIFFKRAEDYRIFTEKPESAVRRMCKAFNRGIKTRRSFMLVSHGDPIMDFFAFLQKRYKFVYPKEYIRKGEIIEIEFNGEKFKHIRTIRPSFQRNRH